MDEKHRPQPHPNTMASPCRIRARDLLIVVALFMTIYQIWNNVAAVPFLPQEASDLVVPTRAEASSNGLVPLEAHIISKCPDTRVRNKTRSSSISVPV
jgi:hypothetical protein